MKWPPFLLKMRFQNREHAFALWLPLFLIGPLLLVFLLAVVLILLPFALIALMFSWETGWLRSDILIIPSVLRLLSQLRGLLIDVEGERQRVFIEFI